MKIYLVICKNSSNFVSYFGSMGKGQQDILSSGCASCQMREACQTLGETSIPRKQSWKAVAIAYILPFILLIGVVLTLNGVLDNEPLVGTIALCTVGIYYIILHLCRKHIETDFQCKNNIKQ